MLKHVQISPLRNRADSVSLRSSTSCASSLCGSPEPPHPNGASTSTASTCSSVLQRTPSRASSYSSLNEHLPQTTIKVFTNCLKIDIEYKTLGIQWDTTSKEVITQLLRRLKMRHRDPRLFYLSMEVCVRRAGVKTIMVLDDDTRPAILQACHPKGESRFCLQLKPGGLIRVHTSALQPTSQYKALIISEETTSDELLQLLLSCYNSLEPVEQFSIYEVCPGQEYQRKLHPDDIPLRAQAERMKRGETCHFLVRRNPGYAAARRRQLLNSLNEVMTASGSVGGSNNKSFDANSSISSLEDAASLLDVSIESLTEDLRSLLTTSDEDEDCASSTSGSSDTSSEGSTTVRRTSSKLSVVPIKPVLLVAPGDICPQCRNNFKSCEFCHENSTLIHGERQKVQQRLASGNIKGVSLQLPSYNPVYNIREIRTASHSFSSLGSDKKLLDIQLNARFDPATLCALAASPAAATSSPATTPSPSASPTPSPTGRSFRLRPQSLFLARPTRMLLEAACKRSAADVTPQSPAADCNTNKMLATSSSANFLGEAVHNHPAKGLGHFVYL